MALKNRCRCVLLWCMNFFVLLLMNYCLRLFVESTLFSLCFLIKHERGANFADFGSPNFMPVEIRVSETTNMVTDYLKVKNESTVVCQREQIGKVCLINCLLHKTTVFSTVSTIGDIWFHNTFRSQNCIKRKLW